MRAHRAMAVGTACLISLGVAACGSNSGGGGAAQTSTSAPGSSSAGSGSAHKLAVTETEFKIAPANPKIAKAGKVTLTIANRGQFPHALEIEGNGLEEQKTDTIPAGKTATLTVDLAKNGTYEWYCPIDGHRQKGMEGKITVGRGGEGGGTTSESSGKKSSY